MAERIKHEYLKEEDYYETNSVGTRAHSSYSCEHCGSNIPKGTPHSVHKFYPEFQGYRTHHKCDDKFLESLLKDGEKSTYDDDEEE